MRWCSWLRYCATSRNVKGSILDGGIIWIFDWLNASCLTKALSSTHLTDTSTGSQGIQSCHTHVSIVDKLWETRHPGSLRAYQGRAFTCASSRSALLNKPFQNPINLLAPELLFLILAHTVYKMWIIQEPNTLELWNKLHFEEEK